MFSLLLCVLVFFAVYGAGRFIVDFRCGMLGNAFRWFSWVMRRAVERVASIISK